MTPALGLTVYHPDKAEHGYTLFAPMTGTSAYLIDMQGRIVQHWALPYRPGAYGYLLDNGHLLVAPLAHKGRLDEIDTDELLDLQVTLRRMIAVLDEAMKPDGYNVGLNLGRVAGAGLPGHLHWHVVPRWHGDTNFMPVLADTKVIAQALDSLYDLLVGDLTKEASSQVV